MASPPERGAEVAAGGAGQEHGGNRRQILERFGHARLLDFSASINPLGHPEGLRERLWATWEEVLHYPERDCAGLRQALAGAHGLSVERVLPGNGSAELIELAVRALAPRRLVLSPPDFGLYARVAPPSLPVVKIPRSERAGFAPDVEALGSSLREGDLVLLSQPGNPSGAAAAREELLELLCRSARSGAVLALDEAFADFCPEESLLGEAGRPALLVFRSLTKIYGIPGLRLGFVAGEPAVLEELGRLQIPWSVNTFAQVAGCHCVGDAEWVPRTLEVVARERALLEDGIRGLAGFRPLPSRANYLLVELSAPAPTASELYDALAREGLLIRHCGSFGLGERFVRVAVRRREENERLLQALGRAARKELGEEREAAAP